MLEKLLSQLYDNIPIPVAAFSKGGEKLLYANPEAKLLLDPQRTSETFRQPNAQALLEGLVCFASDLARETLFQQLERAGYISNFSADLRKPDGRELRVSIQANRVQMDECAFELLYFPPVENGAATALMQPEGVLSSAFHLASQIGDADEAISRLLGLVGGYVDVSRAYIFEEISEDSTSNTYEWCAEGVAPAIQDLQELKKEDYSYDVVVNSGMFITDDVRKLSEADRVVLEPQGIKSMAVIPLFAGAKALGYMGFDDCVKYRQWGDAEIALLRYAADIVSSLIARRNTEAAARRNHQILQRISDHIDSIIYVSDIKTYDLIFVNKALARSQGKQAEEMLGKKCYHVLQKGFDAPCDFCPLKKMLDEQGNVLLENYTWEFQNTRDLQWYLARDAVFPWEDGRLVHIETATDITHQKRHAEELQYIASMDMLTGIHNREWGYKILKDMTGGALAEAGDLTLVFIDVDGLKHVNDTFGHAYGDKLLTKTVELVCENVRRNDILFRWGGDEFILLLQCKMSRAQQIMRGIEAQLQAFNETGELPFALAFSYGMLDLREHRGESIDTLITRADELMYANKMAKRQEK